MSSTRSTRSKREEASTKIKISLKDINGGDDDSEEEEVDETNMEDSDEDESSASEKRKPRKDESINRAAFSMPHDLKKLMERVTCCSCGKQLNPMNPGAVRKQPWLKVVTCKKCYRFLKSGPFTRDSEGVDEQCRWCGDGGRLYGCDYCNNCFCRACIKRNMGRSEAAAMENEDNSKWHCYICKPKKIKKLVEDCDKILKYIQEQERKDKEKEERARLREKEKEEKRKLEKAKKKEKSEKDGENGKDEKGSKGAEEKSKDDKKSSEEKSTPKRGLPAPRDKSQIVEKIHSEKKTPPPADGKSTPDLIVVEDSPVASKLHHRATDYKPDVKTGVKSVQRIGNNLTAVTVGPKNAKPVVNILPKSTVVTTNQVPKPAKPMLVGMLTGNSGPIVFQNTGRSLLKKTPPPNDIKALKSNIFPYNVEDVIDKLATTTQSLSLCLNSVKTDLAIAKLSNTNMNQARIIGATNVKNGIDVFCNRLREVLNVQLVANYPHLSAPEKSAGDAAPIPLSSTSLTSTPKGKSNALIDPVTGKLNESSIPIEIDDSSDSIPTKTEIKDEKVIDLDETTDSESKETEDKKIKVESKETSSVKIETKKEEKVKEEVDDKKVEMVTDDENVENGPEEMECDEQEDEDKSKTKGKDSAADKDSTGNNDSENTAAELELLKEMADELNEQEEKLKEPRRSSRARKPGIVETAKSESDSESPVRRSSRSRQKPDASSQGKKDNEEKLTLERSSRRTSDAKKSEKKKEDSEVDEDESSKEKKKKSIDKEMKGIKSKIDDIAGKKDKGKKKEAEDSETSDKEEDEDKSEEEKDEKVERRSSRSKRSDSKGEVGSGKKDQKKLKEVKDESDDETEAEVEKVERKSRRVNKPDSKENIDESETGSKSPRKPRTSGRKKGSDSDETDPDEIVAKHKKLQEKKKISKKSEEADDDDDDTEEFIEESKGKSVKKGKPSDKSKDVSDFEGSDSEIPEKKEEKSKGKAKKDEKSDKKTKVKDVLDENDDDVPMDESDTSDSSDEPVEEFGKRKKKRKAPSQEKDEVPRRQTRQAGKKSETNTENSDTDPNFDSDLEKEIETLSKHTRLTRKKAKETQMKNDSKGKKQKKGKDSEDEEKKKGKKKTLVEESDSSESENEEVSDEDDNDSDDDNMEENLSASQLKKLKQADQIVSEEESDNDDRQDDGSSEDSSDELEVSFPKLGSGKKGKKHEVESESDDSDFVTPKKKKRVAREKLLDAKISDSESDTGKKGKKGKGKKGQRKRKKEDSDEFSELSDEAENRKRGPQKGKKRRRIKDLDSSDEEKKKSEVEDSEKEEDEENTPGGFQKRKHIRRVIGSKKLTDETKAAQKAEEERRKRIEERQKEYNSYVEVEGGESETEELPEGTEREVVTPAKKDGLAKILGSPKKVPVTTKCVLEMEKDKKKPKIQVNPTLIKKLKPHQVEAVRFMYNCCVESVDRLKKEEGSGCILAHCMGLGKTLSVITFVHTMLSNVKWTKMSKCLVVCPLNTCLNWVNEFEVWLSDVDFEIEVYEMSNVKQNFERAQMLKEWHEGGAAVMIMGYDMYRNLVMGSHCKSKKQKKIFYDTLVDPGPDLVVCDEGHILKNDATSLSKAMNKIVSRRRIVLTGTPLQNNLGEYHCMVDFVKPALLGTRKEFNNRFCNPIVNGQCRDSTAFDFKLMKRRAHILHELLAGCVQRKDYSALTKFLPPKFEYVISVRLAPVQMTLYAKYLELNLGDDIKGKGARLFTDYQALMRIWTHPWVLKLDEIRQENKRAFDDEDEDSFIDDSDSGDDSFIDDSTSSQSSSSEDDSSSNKKKKKRKTRGNKGNSSSSDEDSKKENGDEVVKKWKSKRRGNEEGAGSSWMEDMGYGGPKELTTEWWAEFVKEEDEYKIDLSGKLVLMFEILKMCEDIGDKVLVFSQSILSLNIIEDFLAKVDEANNPTHEESTEDKDKPAASGASASGASASGASASGASGSSSGQANGEAKTGDEKTQDQINKERLTGYGKSWCKGLDYFRMDGSTSSINRKSSQDQFNDPENYRARLFLISTKAGSLGINLVSANRVIIFDASWNPSHDIQSIFRVYRFGQVKPVYVYRFLAQGTMEEKIYERQVTKQSLSQRVVDEHQIERHFNANDLQELYRFQPDRLDDKENKDKPLPILPKDHMLAELMTNNKDWIVKYHEHDSLLENVVEQELTEDEKKAAWEDYENEKKGISNAMGGGASMNAAMFANQQMTMQNLLMQGQANLGQAAVLQIVQDLKMRFPNLPPEVFQQRVQAVLRQVLTQQIMQQSEMQRRQIEQHRLDELNRLNQIKQEIQRQQAMINTQNRAFNMGGAGMHGSASTPNLQGSMSSGLRPQTLNQLQMRNLNQQKK